jgi:hypothetical protein
MVSIGTEERRQDTEVLACGAHGNGLKDIIRTVARGTMSAPALRGGGQVMEADELGPELEPGPGK